MVLPDPTNVAFLVGASADGDEAAWSELLRRYAPLVIAIIRQHRLPTVDAEDVCQTVWLRLVEHLPDIREPAALAGWIASVTRHECLHSLRLTGRLVPVDPVDGGPLDRPDGIVLDSNLLAAERHQVLRDALAELPAQHRELLALLAADPPPSYVTISEKLGIPIGSIGPTRGRILARLRETNAVQTYLAAAGDTAPSGGGRHADAGLE